MGRFYSQAKSPEDYLLSRVKLDSTTGCLNWIKGKDKDGYGQCHSSKYGRELRVTRAHQMAWVIRNGAIPSNKIICHHCDNPSCCNTDHLYLGTWESNVQDCVSRGRFDNGAKRKRSNEEVIAFHGKLSCEDAAEILGLSYSRVCQIWREHGLRGKQFHNGVRL